MANYNISSQTVKNAFHVVFGKTALAVVLPLFFIITALPAAAQTAMIDNVGVYYKNNPSGSTTNAIFCDWPGAFAAGEERSFVSSADGTSSTDPWKLSALIEYDKPYGKDQQMTVDSYPGNGPFNYPNHCLGMCMDVRCVNPPTSGSTYSISFPIQDIKFEVVKYYDGKNIYNPDETPSIRPIVVYPGISDDAICAGYACAGASAEKAATCATAKYACLSAAVRGGDGDDKEDIMGYNCVEINPTSTTIFASTETCLTKGSFISNCMIKTSAGAGVGDELRYCASWDGSYEIAGEFGKTNGQFAFRSTVHTSYPGDNVVVEKIEFTDVKAYPGMNQIPIQVDVTNVHTVRSTPTVVGTITAIPAQPYTFAYRLSKDAYSRVLVYDASRADWMPQTESSGTITTWNALRRVVADWRPALGEGIKGQAADKLLTEFDSWDGRDRDGRLLPAGNYVVALQAKTSDEWPGTDFSRAVTRQMSLDPLRLTDLTVTGLNKQSTAYATLRYVPTEASTVHLQVYTPGTIFTNTVNRALYTKSYEQTGTGPTAQTGSLVYTSSDERSGRMNYATRWDGLCGAKVRLGETLPGGGTCNIGGGCPTSCTRIYSAGDILPDGAVCKPGTGATTCSKTFAYGAPMPDGNYVYVLWAEIPYNTVYHNATSGGYNNTATICTDKDNGCYTAVKTIEYETGSLPLERGLVDITIQPVSYSTIGSSPTAYGLDPFVFKYSVSRDSTVVARVENTAGVLVKSLTPDLGATNVAQQLNTLTWDGRDNQGRMVTPGTYMFTVQSKDGMFPSMVNKASAVFPVDMYRVVDVSTTDVYGDSEAKATISYYLSKAMNVQINIYNKDVVLPNYNTTTGDYAPKVTVINHGSPTTACTAGPVGTTVTYEASGDSSFNRTTITAVYDPVACPTAPNTFQTTTIIDEVSVAASTTASWPPRICNKTDDINLFTAEHIDPTKVAANPGQACIYVNDITFTNYPQNAGQAGRVNELDVRLQPVKTFDRSAERPGEGLRITEEWDALYFYNPSSAQCQGQTDLTQCKYEMVPDGQYPFFLSARTNEAANRYYAKTNGEVRNGRTYIAYAPFTNAMDTVQENFIYATEKPISRINVTRGPVFFLENTVKVFPNAPQLFNASSGPIFIPPYEINFAVSRASTVEVAVVALGANVCNPIGGVSGNTRQNKPGDVCKYLSTTTIINTGSFDPNVTRKVYWDGTDNNGYYVKSGIYEVRLIAKNYPDPGLYQETVKSITINADITKVFDLLEADGYSQAYRGADIKVGYQISVPMKVAMQIFKPGTTIFDYQKGTLRNPATGKEVVDINEVLVRSIVGIRPATTLIEELWDGRDYAQQEVPDGTYPFRFVTALNSADINTITGAIEGANDSNATPDSWAINKVADTMQYQTLHKMTVAIGDGRFVCSDWERTVFFYPNPFRGDNGTLEITKMPVPGVMSLKFYTLDGTIVREAGYTCVDANNYETVIGGSFAFNPDNNISNIPSSGQSVRNAALRCRWDRTNQHGKKVARGVYFGLVDFKAQSGREHCQKVVKVLIP